MRSITALAVVTILSACSVAGAVSKDASGQREVLTEIPQPATAAEASPALTAASAAMELQRVQTVKQIPAYYTELPTGSGTGDCLLLESSMSGFGFASR